jgi:hypothetical protein
MSKKTRIIPIEVSRLLKILKGARGDEKPYILAVPFGDGTVDFLAMSNISAVILTARNPESASLIGYDGETGIFDFANKVEGLIRIPAALMHPTTIPNIARIYEMMEGETKAANGDDGGGVYDFEKLAQFTAATGIAINADANRRALKEALCFSPRCFAISTKANDPGSLLLRGKIELPEHRVAYSFDALFMGIKIDEMRDALVMGPGPQRIDRSNPFAEE